MIHPIILAAGKGTRMKWKHPKVLYEVGGKPMLRWVLEALATARDFEKPIIVIGHKGQQVRTRLGSGYQYVVQEELTGTGSAVRACMPLLEGRTDPVLILNGDHPFIRPRSLEAISELFERERPTLTLFTTAVSNFEDWRSAFLHFGRIVRDTNGAFTRIVEYKEASQAERSIREVNPGIYCVERPWLINTLPQIKPNPTTGEYHLTDLIHIAKVAGKRILTLPLSPREALGINSQEDAARAEEFFQGIKSVRIT